VWQADDGTTFLRVVFCGAHAAPAEPPRLDDGIIDVLETSKPRSERRPSGPRDPDDQCRGGG
jgi:hypothetical protein